MKLIIGLGNPGEEYRDTRHNLGFMILDTIAQQEQADFEFNKQINADIAKVSLDGEQTIFIKPQTYVNKSGETVAKALKFYSTAITDIVVIHDDLDIQFGQTKLSIGKGPGGHNGISSIIDHLKTEHFWRLKIGIANEHLRHARKQPTLEAKKEAVAKFVLSRFTEDEYDQLSRITADSLVKLKTVL